MKCLKLFTAKRQSFLLQTVAGKLFVPSEATSFLPQFLNGDGDIVGGVTAPIIFQKFRFHSGYLQIFQFGCFLALFKEFQVQELEHSRQSDDGIREKDKIKGGSVFIYLKPNLLIGFFYLNILNLGQIYCRFTNLTFW